MGHLVIPPYENFRISKATHRQRIVINIFPEDAGRDRSLSGLNTIVVERLQFKGLTSKLS